MQKYGISYEIKTLSEENHWAYSWKAKNDGANWGSVSKYPSRLNGSIYDGTIQIGGTSQKGQYDFFRETSVGDPVYFTDMEGNRYAYAVTDIHYEKHADQEAFHREESAMTLFIKNIYGFEYIVVFCNTLG